MPIYLAELIGDGRSEATAFRPPVDGVGAQGSMGLGGPAICWTSDEVTGERRLFKLGDLPDETLTRRQLGELETRLGLPALQETGLGAVVHEIRQKYAANLGLRPLGLRWETETRPLPPGALPRVRRIAIGKMVLFQTGTAEVRDHRTIIGADNFDSLGTGDLHGRTMVPTSIGTTWTGAPTTGGMVGDGSGGVVPTSGNDEGWYDSGVNSFYEQIKYHPNNADNRFGIQSYLTGESHNGATPTGYHCNIQPNPNVMRLFERTSGSFNKTGEDLTTTLPNNAQSTWRLEIQNGTSEDLYADIGSGITLMLHGTDGTHTVESHSFTQFLLQTTGPVFDDWEVDDLTAAGGPLVQAYHHRHHNRAG